jgi:hypothetical protein
MNKKIIESRIRAAATILAAMNIRATKKAQREKNAIFDLLEDALRELKSD